MRETAPDFRLRAVISKIERDYIVSISKVSTNNDITLIGEEEVSTIQAAHDFVEQIAKEHSFPPDDVDKLYNIAGKIASKPPKGTK